MAEDEDGASNKKSPQNSDNEASSSSQEASASKPDLGIEESKYNSNESTDGDATDAANSSPKSSGAVRKEDNPFSFRHFLKRDLSLPGGSTYENTGARPKVYANTVQHSPTKLDVHTESKRESKARATESQTKEQKSDNGIHRISESDSSIEIPFSLEDNSDTKRNIYSSFYHRPNIASEPLGMPSLPDFVQDHILVEQAYLNPNVQISVDLENLPDFTFNTSFNECATSSGRRNNTGYGGNRSYDYESDCASNSNVSDRASASNEPGAGWCPTLDLPPGAAAADGPHLSLDLTESVNSADRRNNSPRNTFPLDLPTNADSMRLPDFLPVHPGRTSPEPEHQDQQLQQIIAELERTRCDLFTERNRRSRAESELEAAREDLLMLRRDRRAGGAAAASASASASADCASTRIPDTDPLNVAKLKSQIKKLKEDLSESQAEVARLRAAQRGAARGLRQASLVAESSLRELLAGLDQLKSLSSSLDPT